MYTIICKHCCNEYESKFARTKFCSDLCRSRYNSKNKGHDMVCANCNNNFKSYDKNTYCSDKCREEVLEIKRAEKEKNQRELERAKEEIEKLKVINKLSKIIKTVSDKYRNCKCCNKEYFIRTKGRTPLYCSDECRKKLKRVTNNKKKIDRDKRLVANGKVDYSVNLKDLHERDKGICHLCNELTDYNDFYVSEKEHFVTGHNYPSIDHVIPISKGGTHDWENVKLAHMICNAKRRNETI